MSKPSRAWLRSLGAVIGGFATTFVLSVATDAAMHRLGWFPAPGKLMAESLFIVAALYRGVFTVAGGYVTARLAPSRPLVHAGVLGGIGLLAGAAGVMAYYHGAPGVVGPAWYALSIPAMAVPCVLAGALLQSGRRMPTAI